MKKAFRDWPSVVLIILTFSIAVLFTTIVGGLLTQLYKSQKHMLNPNWYPFSKYITVSRFEGNSDDFCFSLKKVLSQTTNHEVTIGYSPCDGKIDFFSGGYLPEVLHSGDVLVGLTLQDANDEFVYIDQKSLAECETKGTNLYYRTVNGLLRVQGELYNSYGVEEKIYHYVDINDSKNLWYLHDFSLFLNSGDTVTFFVGGDNEKKVENGAKELLKLFNEGGFEASFSNKDVDSNTEAEFMSSLRVGIFLMVMLLAFGTLLNAVQLWMVRRRRNISIILALGGSRKTAFHILAKEFAPIGFIAVISSVLIECIYGRYQTVQWKEILGMTAFAVLLCVFGIVFYMIFLMKAMIKRGFLDVIAGE